MNDPLATKPVIAKCEPSVIDVEADRLYSWCTCGFSQSQPFCDTAHRGRSTMKSLKLMFDKPQKVRFCQCKQTSTPPFCDRTHETLGEDDCNNK
ncbi:CDGSH iron-sulfur domain-containing protein [bacterium]|nr:CDGSH iron-sulfur domain-containing protein [bacterium]